MPYEAVQQLTSPAANHYLARIWDQTKYNLLEIE